MPQYRKRADVLYRLYREFEKRKLVFRIPCCTVCQRDGHTTSSCKAVALDISEAKCERESCQEIGHITALCPTRICRDCEIQGHSANECPTPLTCKRCGNVDHLIFECKTTPGDFTCNNCEGKGHTYRDCAQELKTPRGIACNACGEQGHIARQCPKKDDAISCNRCSKVGHTVKDCTEPRGLNVVCRTCQQRGHRAAVCPERVCRKCGEKGHHAEYCNVKWCHRCKQVGHEKDQCRKPTPKCERCNGPHQSDKCRAGDNSRGSAGQRTSVIRVNKDCVPPKRNTLRTLTSRSSQPSRPVPPWGRTFLLGPLALRLLTPL